MLYLITKIVFTIGNNITSIDHKLTEILLLANISQRAIALDIYTVESITISKINKINNTVKTIIIGDQEIEVKQYLPVNNKLEIIGNVIS